jgi:PAS domain S-box-containing protein
LSYALPVLFFLLAAIPAAAIGVLLTRGAWDRELQTVHEQHLQLARHLAEALARYAHDVEATFQLTAANIVAHRSVAELRNMLDRLHFKHVCIVDRAGQVQSFVSSDFRFHIESVPAALLGKLRALEVRGAPTLAFSNVLLDSKGDPTIFLWQPLDEERYALGALKTDYFVQLQRAISIGQQGHAAIVDRSGHIIAHPNPQWQATAQDISQVEPVRLMMAGKTGVTRFFGPALGDDLIAGFTTVPKTGWGVMIPQPISELETHVGRVKRAVWQVIGAALLCATILGGFVSRWLAAPLQQIGVTAERFAHGADAARVRNLGWFHTREAATLASQFNGMADALTRSAQAQRESEQRFREFAHIAADWFWETDLQQVFTYSSPPAAAGRHWDSDALLGQHRRAQVDNDPEGKIVALIQNTMDRQEAFDNVQYQIRGSNGEPRFLSVAGKPMRNAMGEVIGYRGVAQDITERLHTEEQLRYAQQEEQVYQSRKMEAIGTLAGGIAHDFNNILAAILGYTELTLPDVAANTNAQRNLQAVLAASTRAKELVQQILTFSRKNKQERTPLQLHQVVAEALTLLRASLPATITIRPDLAEDTAPVLAEATQIHQVIMNLGANAEYAMRATGGTLDVRLDAITVDEAFTMQHPTLRPGPHVRLTVRDTGPGIPLEVQERIFEPFFTTKGVGQGTGMGLAVAHGIVANHGGIITVQSRPGEGTIFEIFLPQCATPPAEPDHAKQPPPYGSGSILLIDDEEALARLGRMALEHLGYDVVVSTKSREALETFRSSPHRFDLVVTDQTMPEMTGEALAKELRAIRADIPIILCTGFSHTIDAAQATSQGINAFLIKPITPRELGHTIQKVLAQQGSQSR